MRTQTALVIAAMAVSPACGKTRDANPETAGEPRVQVLATVDGVPITSHDLDLRLGKIAAGGSAHDVSNNVLNTIVRDELITTGASSRRSPRLTGRGEPFEKVAARRFPALPANARAPWDLGELRWQQLPQAWKGVVDRLEPGQISGVIKGEGERYWVVKLVSKTDDPQITFATEKERIVEALTQQKAAQLYERTLAEMSAKASVVYSK